MSIGRDALCNNWIKLDIIKNFRFSWSILIAQIHLVFFNIYLYFCGCVYFSLWLCACLVQVPMYIDASDVLPPLLSTYVL